MHAHVAVKRPTRDATKIWLTRSGGLKLAHNKGGIPNRDLRDIMRFVAANHGLNCPRDSLKVQVTGFRHSAALENDRTLHTRAQASDSLNH